MALIQSGSGADLLDVTAAKSAKATLYDAGASGAEILPLPTRAFLLPILVRQTGATAAASTVWAARNVAGPQTVYIRRIRGAVTFDGTAAAATTIGYDFMRFSVATPTGGTALTPIKKRSAYAASNVSDARFLDTGLTVAGVTFETPFARVQAPISVTSMIRPFEIDFSYLGDRGAPFELASGEGLAIQLTATAVIGLGISGWVEYDER